MEVRKLRVTAKDDQDVINMILHRWPDYEFDIQRLPDFADRVMNWYEVTLRKPDIRPDKL